MKTTFRMWIAIIAIALAIIAINPLGYFEKGVLIKSVKKDSYAAEQGLQAGEIIKQINEKQIEKMQDYGEEMHAVLEKLKLINFSIETKQGTFFYESTTLDFFVDENLTIILASGKAAEAGLRENMTLQKINNFEIRNISDFEEAKKIEVREKIFLKTNKQELFMLISNPLDITASEIPKTNLKAGLDLQGGAKALVKPEKKLNEKEMQDLIAVVSERLNVYGIADVVVRSASDLSGNKYMLIEIAGATPSELEELVAKQGKFEAKIGNETIFVGGRNDITSVCKADPKCERIEQCLPSGEGFFCRFSFSVYLSEEAAKRQANATASLQENLSAAGERYLSKTLDLYLDDKLVDSLQIASDLKGKAVTQVAISGPGISMTKADAYNNAEQNMKKLQTILITGSLPFKLQIEKLDSISPMLGKEFVNNIIITIFFTSLAVSLIIFLRYKKMKFVLPSIVTIFVELLLTLGIASLIKWNLDLASIAGLIAAIGTGVDDQIVMLDESRVSKEYGWKERLKRAFFIMMGAYATVAVAMLPLWQAGAGLLKGFALTTLIEISVGVLITRPAFADILSQLKE